MLPNIIIFAKEQQAYIVLIIFYTYSTSFLYKFISTALKDIHLSPSWFCIKKISADNRKLFYFDALRVAMSVTNTASGRKKYQKRKIKTTN